jgi:hypothetical protein
MAVAWLSRGGPRLEDGVIGASRRDFAVLLGLAVLVLGFVAYEMAGLTIDGWHSVSWYAQHNIVLAAFIGVLFIAGGLGGLLWWIRHLRSRIPR